jgi:hypothetical protein
MKSIKSVKMQIVDSEMQYTKILQGVANEIDVVGTFNTTAPKIVLKTEGLVIIPYDAIALLSEVKSELTKRKLEEDLNKLRNIMQLKISSNRFLPQGVLGFKEMKSDIPFRLLVYFKKSIDDAVMEGLLTQYLEVWDVVFLVQKEEVIINRTLPFVNSLFEAGLQDRSPDKKFLIWTFAPFMILLSAITRTIPVPFAVDVMKTILNIAVLAGNQAEE